jgi:hypothetical protein
MTNTTPKMIMAFSLSAVLLTYPSEAMDYGYPAQTTAKPWSSAVVPEKHSVSTCLGLTFGWLLALVTCCALNDCYETQRDWLSGSR